MLKTVLFSLLVLPAMVWAASPQATTSTITRSQDVTENYVGVAWEYDSPTHILGAQIVGYAYTEEMCNKGLASTPEPAGHAIKVACIHIKFTGHPEHGQVAMGIPVGIPIDYIAFAFEYNSDGNFIAGRALGDAHDAATCKSAGRASLDLSYKNGKFPPEVSVIVYCEPVYRDSDPLAENQVAYIWPVPQFNL